jgi:hypothetical protein
MGVKATFNGMHRPMNHMKLLLLSLLALTVAIGCKKAQPTEVAPVPENAGSPAPATASGNSPQPANQPASQAPAAPTIDATKAVADVNAALKARDYQKATDTLLVLQRQKLTEQQSTALHGQMVQLQGAVAAGVASGDPNAKAAADRLRAESMH